MTNGWQQRLFLAVAIVAATTGFAQSDPDEKLEKAAGAEEIDEGQIQFERMRWFQAARLDDKGRFQADGRTRALEQMEANILSGKLGDVSLDTIPGDRWTAIGPMPLDVRRWGSNPPIYDTYSGRVTAIATHPLLPGTAYIGGAQGGVWKTSNSGTTWKPLTDTAPSLAIGSLAIDPATPTTVYAGTGEPSFSCDSYFGRGILKSTDAGATWTVIGSSTFSNAAVSGIVIHPTVPSTLWASSANGYAGIGCAGPVTMPPLGVFKSTNGGSTWTQVLGQTQIGFNAAVTGLVREAGSADVLYAAVYGAGIWRTLNGGTTWTRLQSILPTAIGRSAVAVDPVVTGVVYAIFESSTASRQVPGLYKSTDGGTTWVNLPMSLPSTCGGALLDMCTYPPAEGDPAVGACWYHLVLGVAPDRGIWIGGIGLWRSGNLGASWQNECTPNSHVDHHAIAFKGNTIWVGNDGGVFMSADNGATFTSTNQTLGLTQFYPGASVHPKRLSGAMGGTQDNGSLKTTGADTWREGVGGDGASCAYDPTSPDTTFYQSSQFLGFRKTTDGGATWYENTTGLADADDADHSAFIAPFVVCPNNGNVLIAGSDNVWRTNNAAGSWFANSGDPLASGAKIVALAFSKATGDCSTYFAGTANGRVYRTKDSGVSWQEITGTIPAFIITDLAPDPGDPNTLLVSVAGFGHSHVWRTFDALTVAPPPWGAIDAGIPDTPVNAVLIDPTNANVIYLGTDIGIFRSTNYGQSWAAFNTGHPNVAVYDLQANPVTGRIVSFTHGRGAFRLTSPCDDKSLCTTDYQDPTLGCQYTPVNCDDGSMCTVDNCDPEVGCTHQQTSTCSDGNPCTIGDYCSGTTCVPGSGALPTPLRMCSGTATSIPAVGDAFPYPSIINVAGGGSVVCKVTVELNGLTHAYPDDIDVMLDHDGVNSVIFSDVGGSTPVTGVNVVLSDAAAASVPDEGPLVSGTYKPTDIQLGVDGFSSPPAPAPQASSMLTPFNGMSPNGSWALWVADQVAPDGGTLDDWCVNLSAVCSNNAECDDGNPCTVDRCELGGCRRTPSAGACDDGDACTSGDVCAVTFSETFDQTEAPALPAGWTATPNSGDRWIIVTPSDDASPNAAFTGNAGSITDKRLDSPTIVLPAGSSKLTFRHRYALEKHFDGAVLEISIGGGAFTDILAAGGSFSAWGYNDTISAGFGNPLAGRMGWTWASAGYPAYHTVVVNLPPFAMATSVVLRWRVGTDSNISGAGEWVDSVTITAAGDAPCYGIPIDPSVCDDGNPCTDDSCLSPIGCAHANSASFCSDGDSCGTLDMCIDGACVPTPPPSLPSWTVGLTLSKTQALWGTISGATGYDLVRGDLGLLRSSLGNFTTSTTECLADDLPVTAVDELDVPAPGTGFFYVLRGTNCSGSGTYDTTSPKQFGSRDAEIDAAPITCGTSCGRDKCLAGPAIDAGCGGCVASICTVDPYCCDTEWDGWCMDEVRTVCSSLVCPSGAGVCAHTACTLGGPLVAGCDDPPVSPSCVTAICDLDPYCCDMAWDWYCVAEVSSVCGMNCQ